jgi:hypothetical protein
MRGPGPSLLQYESGMRCCCELLIPCLYLQSEMKSIGQATRLPSGLYRYAAAAMRLWKQIEEVQVHLPPVTIWCWLPHVSSAEDDSAIDMPRVPV